MTNETARNAVQKFSNIQLQHVRRTLEAEALAMVANQTNTQAFWGRLEILEAIGEELAERGALLPAPLFVDICHENGVRSGVTVRVF